MTGKALRKFRLSRGISTAAAAKAVMAARSSWVRWESLPVVPRSKALLISLVWPEAKQ